MGSFGDKLKREREMRAITLEEIAEATKIGTRSLKALEEEHFDQLPGGIFNKGFVRAYAKFLGIDEEQAVADYMAATGDVGSTTAMQMAALADQVEHQRAAKEASNTAMDTGLMLAIILGVVVVSGIGFGGYKAWRFKSQQQVMAKATAARVREVPPPVSLQSSTVPATSTTPVTTSEAPLNPPSAKAPESTRPATSPTNTPSTSTSALMKQTTAVPSEFPINVTIKAVKSSWVKVTSDGKTVYQQMLEPTDRQLDLHGREKMQLVLGNAAGVEVSFNGKSMGSLGNENQARKLTFTPSGIEQ